MAELEVSCDENAPSSPLTPKHREAFTKGQTLYIIDLIRQHIEADGKGPPKSLKELNSRLRAANEGRMALWEEIAVKLGSNFDKTFLPGKVKRKWFTLVEAYKKVKEVHARTGKGPVRFEFFREMDELLGGHFDVLFPVVGTSRGLKILRADGCDQSNVDGAFCVPFSSTPFALSPGSQSTSAGVPFSAVLDMSSSATPTNSCNKRQKEDEILVFLREAEAACQQRHDDILAQLKSAQQGFESYMAKIVDKM